MNNVAGTLCELGRYAEAIALFEKTLELRLRVLPGNHPDIGEWPVLALAGVLVDRLLQRV